MYVYNPYLNELETLALLALVKSVAPKVMIEIGCRTGRTAKTLLDHIESLEVYIGVDVPFNHKPTLACQQSEVPFTAGLFAAGDKRFSTLVRPRGSLELVSSDLEPCDVMFIDGDHSEQAVRHDSNLARELVCSGGVIIWHDYGNPAVEVTQVLMDLRSQGWMIKRVEETWLAFMRV